MSINLTNRDKALAAWGAEAPAWVLLLADECDRSGQRIAGNRIGYNSAVVSRIVNAKYPGDLAEVETLVRAALGAEQVMCPVFGVTPLKRCITNRRRTRPANWAQVQLARACPDCPNNTDRPEED